MHSKNEKNLGLDLLPPDFTKKECATQFSYLSKGKPVMGIPQVSVVHEKTADGMFYLVHKAVMNATPVRDLVSAELKRASEMEIPGMGFRSEPVKPSSIFSTKYYFDSSGHVKRDISVNAPASTQNFDDSHEGFGFAETTENEGEISEKQTDFDAYTLSEECELRNCSDESIQNCYE